MLHLIVWILNNGMKKIILLFENIMKWDGIVRILSYKSKLKRKRNKEIEWILSNTIHSILF